MTDSETLRSSNGTFDDGGRFRIEIPSVEGPAALETVLEEAAQRDVTIHRISQGSGIAMLNDNEIATMVRLAAESDTELCLFLGPRGTWDIGGGARTPAGGSGPRVRGAAQLRYSLDDARRGAALGVPALLVADEGVLWLLHKMRVSGELPQDIRLKFSALAGPTNPASFALIERLGADSINVPGDLPVADLAAMRDASPTPIDLYLESPDALGGFVRHHEAPEFIDRVGRVYLKLGLRNAPEMYPAGLHTHDLTLSSARERVRRASLLLERLERMDYLKFMSPKPATTPIGATRFSEPVQ